MEPNQKLEVSSCVCLCITNVACASHDCTLFGLMFTPMILSQSECFVQVVAVEVPEVSASAIKNYRPELYDQYAQLCYAGTFVPNRRLQQLVASSVDPSDEQFMLHELRYNNVGVSPVSFRKIKGGSETKVVNLCLQRLLHTMIEGATELGVSKLQTNSKFMAKSCSAEHCVTTNQSGRNVVVLGASAAVVQGFRSCDK